MITIDVDAVTNEETPLIILHKTGIKYTAQCGGVACTHPEAEGFVISIGKFAQDFDDCSYGCQYLSHPDNKDARLKIAHDFDKYCKNETQKWRWQIAFDFERIDEIQEGWLPVIINGTIDDFNSLKLSNAKGIIHNGNCD